jgi:hypothetical protein
VCGELLVHSLIDWSTDNAADAGVRERWDKTPWKVYRRVEARQTGEA